MGINPTTQRPESPLESLLQPGEQLLWSDRPSYPPALRALGMPPRRPAHLLGWALGSTILAGCLLAGATLDLSSGARIGFFLAGGLPTLGLVFAALLAARRHRRECYGLTDRGRVLVRAGSQSWGFPLPEGAALEGDAAFGSLTLPGGPEGAPARLADLPYPATLEPILATCRAARLEARGGG